MEFNFINSDDFLISNYSYSDFDLLVKKFGYQIEKNGNLHNYFNWQNLEHWSFNQELFTDDELALFFSKSIVCQLDSVFYIRLHSDQPIIEVKATQLTFMLNDLTFETGMGWEGVSIDGKFILEFTDSYQHLAKSNFMIVPHTIAIGKR